MLEAYKNLTQLVADCGCFDSLLSRLKPVSYGQQISGEFKSIKLFSYDELRLATDSFHPRKKIGTGGFGTVYEGILHGGKHVAVKVLSVESKQGVDEFLTEIDVISNIKHPNLVELIGCCLQASHRILVYEYVENGNLHDALLGQSKKGFKLTWSMRSAICIGTAQALTFLHEEVEPNIVHRDIKPSNILLGRDFAPKIGDFGLAKLFPDDITHISTRVAGTIGYVAPEYAMHGQLTKKADVYSFGILLLVIVSGRSISRASEPDMEQFLLQRAWELYEQGAILDLVDSELPKQDYPEEEVLRYLKVALFCTQIATSRRPTMPQVVRMLSKKVRLNEAELTRPPPVVRRSRDDPSSPPGRDALHRSPSISSSTDSFTTAPCSFTDMVGR